MADEDKKPENTEPDINEFLDSDLSESERRRLYGDADPEAADEGVKSDAPQEEEKEEFRVPQGPEHEMGQNSYEVYRENLDALLPRVSITQEDRAAFEESLIMNNTPYTNTISIKGSSRSFDFNIRVRMAHEYRLIYMLVAKETAEKRLPDYPAILTRMQEFGMAVMLNSVGDREFPSTGILPNPWETSEKGGNFDDALDKVYAEIYRRTTEKVDAMSQPLFVLALDAFRVFEAKCFNMMPDLMSQSFLEPEQPPSS